jgi:hypothetical protein
MNLEELKEGTEHAQHSGQKEIGLTMAIVAVLLAMATLLGHRAHTEEVVIQGDRNTQWVNFDTKRVQRTIHEDFAALSASLPGTQEKAAEFKEKARLEREGEPGKDGTDKIKEEAQKLDAEMKGMQKRANFYDASELFLEISIILCSISLLVNSKAYWKASFLTTAIGIGVVLWGMLALH